MGSRAFLPVLIATPRRSTRQRGVLWAAAALSVLMSPLVMPAVVQLLAQLPATANWGLLEGVLAQSPGAAAWLMLCAALAAPAWLLYALFTQRGVPGVLQAGVMWALALALWLHLPSAAQCLPDHGSPCALPRVLPAWGMTLAVAMGLFAAAVLVLRGLGWRQSSRSDEIAEWNRYGL